MVPVDLVQRQLAHHLIGRHLRVVTPNLGLVHHQPLAHVNGGRLARVAGVLLKGEAELGDAKFDLEDERVNTRAEIEYLEAELRDVKRRAALAAEEGGAGAKEMLQPSDGTRGMLDFDPPIESVFGLHNWPYPEMPSGTMGTRGGTIMAGAGSFDVIVSGQGGHAAVPHKNKDVIVAGSAVVTSLQTLVSRLTDPLDSVVISVTVFNAGTASNIMPDTAKLQGTLRALNPETFAAFQKKIAEPCCPAKSNHCPF